MSERDGGPAFPVAEGYESVDSTVAQTGMSLRDWFAGQAIAGAVAMKYGMHEEEVAHAAYVFADAMLAERDR